MRWAEAVEEAADLRDKMQRAVNRFVMAGTQNPKPKF